MRRLGFLLLSICVGAALRLHLLVIAPPRHEPTMRELLLGLLIFLCGSLGAAMAVLGIRLLEQVPTPPRNRHRISWGDE